MVLSSIHCKITTEGSWHYDLTYMMTESVKRAGNHCRNKQLNIVILTGISVSCICGPGRLVVFVGDLFLKWLIGILLSIRDQRRSVIGRFCLIARGKHVQIVASTSGSGRVGHCADHWTSWSFFIITSYFQIMVKFILSHRKKLNQNYFLVQTLTKFTELCTFITTLTSLYQKRSTRSNQSINICQNSHCFITFLSLWAGPVPLTFKLQGLIPGRPVLIWLARSTIPG